MIINNVPAVIARKERADGRKFVPTRKSLQAHKISLHRWGKIKEGSNDMTLDEANAIANILGVPSAATLLITEAVKA